VKFFCSYLKFNKALIKSKTGAFVFWEGGVELKYSEGKIYLIQNFGRNISEFEVINSIKYLKVLTVL